PTAGSTPRRRWRTPRRCGTIRCTGTKNRPIRWTTPRWPPWPRSTRARWRPARTCSPIRTPATCCGTADCGPTGMYSRWTPRSRTGSPSSGRPWPPSPSRGGAPSGAYPTAGTSSTSRSPPRSRWAAASPTPGCSRRSAGSPTGTGSRTVTSAYPTRPASGWSSRPPWIPSGTSSSPNSPTSVAPRPRTLAAALLSTALVASVVGLAWRPAMLAAGALTWAAATLVVGRLSRRYRITVLLLAAAGITAIAVGLLHGVPPDWTLVLAGNQPLISMLVAVTFVRLVAPRGGADQAAPTGKAAVWQTTAAVHAFGSVINITALDIVARRVFRSLPLSRPELMVLSRGYSS